MDEYPEISLGYFLRGFNIAKFVTYGCLLVFTIVLMFKLDVYHDMNLVYVFTPLWCLTLLTLVAAVVGVISFIAHRPVPSDSSLRVEFVAMLSCVIEHLLLFCFELMLYYKLKYNPESHLFSWIFVFAPLLMMSIVGIIMSVWSVRHDKAFEFEMFFGFNVVQFVFLAFKLDSQVDWTWGVVFIPLWIVQSLCLIAMLYALILALLLSRSRHLMAANRRHKLYASAFHFMLVFPTLASLILLTSRLDAMERGEYQTFAPALIPLAACFVILMLMSCGSRGGNVWWCGLRVPTCTWILSICPCLREYANISYRFGVPRPPEEELVPPTQDADEIDRIPKIVNVPYLSLDTPD